ncbi:condensation domain-containing protein [Nocardia terpenica]|uniref:Condensation domain-containing protein n=1 Tax=Nocardia terpenica TaxID=455432 RepID=A0A164LMS3_9NOCA|nr:condensation domain-containing protein [Nocardia terpenica]KZM72580.1 hypothetical protein AWN90_27665 [Nocardia terpenica]NQE92538.1 hypothetical protein [Nocardia terpenica]
MRLTAAQAEFWGYLQPDPVTAMFNVAEYADIRGPVDTDLLAAAIRRTVSEVEVLNLRVHATPEGPRFRPVTPDWQLHRVDLSADPDPRAAAEAWMAHDLDTKVRVDADTPFTHALLRLGPEQVLWYHRVHHLMLDGYGLALVARRVAAVYTALADGRDPGAAQFDSLAGVVEFEDADRDSDDYRRAERFWTAYHRDRPAVPTLAPTTAPMTARMARTAADLDPGLVARLRSFRGGPWAHAAIAAIAAYLHRATGAPQVRLCLPVMARTGTPALRVPCTTVNVVYFWAECDADSSLTSLTAQVTDFLRTSRPHQRFRVVDLWRAPGFAFDERRAYGPLANVMPFDFTLDFAGTPATVRNATAGVEEDVGFYLYDRADGGMELIVGGNPPLFTETDLDTHAARFRDLLDRMLAAPDRPLRGLGHCLGGNRGGGPADEY